MTLSIMFQSLLFWIICSGQPGILAGQHAVAFQSLLFWIICSGSSSSTNDCMPWVGFNPCCFGSSVRADLRPHGDLEFRVSILVVLDHLFGHNYTPRPEAEDHVSILVVLDHLFGLMRRAQEIGPQIGFNPCCFGSSVRAAQNRPRGPVPSGGFNPCCFGSSVRAGCYRYDDSD